MCRFIISYSVVFYIFYFLFKILEEVRPYSIDLQDDTLFVMVSNKSDLSYNEMWVDKFGKTVTGPHRKLKVPMTIRHIHERKYPVVGTSNSK